MALFAVKSGGFQIDTIGILDIFTIYDVTITWCCHNNTIIWYIPVTNNINKLQSVSVNFLKAFVKKTIVLPVMMSLWGHYDVTEYNNLVSTQ